MMEDKVERIEALAIGTVEGTANFMEEVNLLKFTLEKDMATLKNQMKLLALKTELKNISQGGDTMSEQPTYPKEADLNQDGIVTKAEYNLYSFLAGMQKQATDYYSQSTEKAQTNAKWMALGSMAFLALLFILDLIRASVLA